ncbi:hypothetical protein DYBT9623_04751 [Dyadobacter sp. CECT 9623]|uniref:Sialate O-acetylesterase domain-containing protein n=1 Tax=Dyadobacter linearis TaxID=2823330 RepID=A0ABM8UWK1_9BACT|nr:sialate O-acetylesterase [Dyadobacter sp. CECT 9623]CAG5073263.1 hypothetical protein DYBT9623_04751 [Dyadobacter sp. CECT 9623]
MKISLFVQNIHCKRLFLTFTIVLISCISVLAYSVSITWPINRSVTQRNSSNKANVIFTGQFFTEPTSETDPCPQYTYYYKVEKLNLQFGTYVSDKIPWTQFSLFNKSAGLFKNELANLDGGWYDLKIMATNGGVGAAVQAFSTIRFGVGDVFIIAGQSNAQAIGKGDNFNQNTYLPNDPSYDCVSVHNFDGTCIKDIYSYPRMEKLIPQIDPTLFRVGANGFNSWCYAPLGKQIAINQQVPSAFFNAAIGGTTVLNWEEGAKGITTNAFGTYLCALYNVSMNDAKGQPYLGLKNALKFYGKVFGLKAVLWHQGEADNSAGTSSANYQSRLQFVINKSRTDFGSPNLTWYVARASLTGGTTSMNVINAQNALIGADPNVHPGPSTDGISTRLDGTHIYMWGLIDLATSWRLAIYGTASNLFPAAIVPTGNFQMGLPGFPILLAAGFNEYRWNSKTNSPGTNPTGDDGFSYVKDPNGNWLLSPEYLRKAFCGLAPARLSAEGKDAYVSNESIYKLIISPNPVTDQPSIISFTLPAAGAVRLEVLDVSGRTIKKLADGFHTNGEFSYPLDMKSNAPGTYTCLLQAETLGITKRFVIVK